MGYLGYMPRNGLAGSSGRSFVQFSEEPPEWLYQLAIVSEKLSGYNLLTSTPYWMSMLSVNKLVLAVSIIGKNKYACAWELVHWFLKLLGVQA